MVHQLRFWLLGVLVVGLCIPPGRVAAGELPPVGLHCDTRSWVMQYMLVRCAEEEERAAFYLAHFPDPDWTPEELVAALQPTQENLEKAADWEFGEGSTSDLVAAFVRSHDPNTELEARMPPLDDMPEASRGIIHQHFRYQLLLRRIDESFIHPGRPAPTQARMLASVASHCLDGHPCAEAALPWEHALGTEPLPEAELAELRGEIAERWRLHREQDHDAGACSPIGWLLVPWLNQTGSDEFLAEMLEDQHLGPAIAQNLVYLLPGSDAARFAASKVARLDFIPVEAELPADFANLEFYSGPIRWALREERTIRQHLRNIGSGNPGVPTRYLHRRSEDLELLLAPRANGFDEEDLRFFEARRAALLEEAAAIEQALAPPAEEP